MAMACLRNALLACVLASAGGPRLSAEPAATRTQVRPRITSMVLTLNDGRSYALTAEQLADPQGGAVFWGEWAVNNLLVPHHVFHHRSGVSAESVHRLWNSVGASGHRPAFLIKTAAGPVFPLDPGGPQENRFLSDASPRTQVSTIIIGYADGRVLHLAGFSLHERRSGVLVWNDHAVANVFIPFYLTNPDLPTQAEDVMRIWNQPTAALATKGVAELPGFMIKPMCIPSYRSDD